jgi:hypothetical protein
VAAESGNVRRSQEECDLVVGDQPMGQAPPQPHRGNGKSLSTRGDIKKVDADEAGIDALIRENARLRELVIQLSTLVVRNAILHK